MICSIGNRRFRSLVPFWAPSLVVNSVLIRPSTTSAWPAVGESQVGFDIECSTPPTFYARSKSMRLEECPAIVGYPRQAERETAQYDIGRDLQLVGNRVAAASWARLSAVTTRDRAKNKESYSCRRNRTTRLSSRAGSKGSGAIPSDR